MTKKTPQYSQNAPEKKGNRVFNLNTKQLITMFIKRQKSKNRKIIIE